MDSKLCWFCEQDPPEVSAALYKTIYHVSERSGTVVIRRVRYSEMRVQIPRCRRCAKFHKRAWFAFWAPIVAWGVMGIPFAVPGLMVGMSIGFVIGLVLQKRVYRRHPIRSLSEETLSTHPLLKGFVTHGWQVRRP